MTNEEDEVRDAPPAVPEWEPSELARGIADGHGREHFPDVSSDDLAREVQRVMDTGVSKRYRRRELYWDAPSGLAVLVNPFADDGGTVFVSDDRYFEEWGEQ